MSEINNISLDQAATNYAPIHAQKREREAFKAGAQWQKEQDKPLYDVANRALDYLSIKYPKESEILHELKKAIESY